MDAFPFVSNETMLSDLDFDDGLACEEKMEEMDEEETYMKALNASLIIQTPLRVVLI